MDWFLYDNGLRHERVNRCLYCESDKMRIRIGVNLK